MNVPVPIRACSVCDCADYGLLQGDLIVGIVGVRFDASARTLTAMWKCLGCGSVYTCGTIAGNPEEAEDT